MKRFIELLQLIDDIEMNGWEAEAQDFRKRVEENKNNESALEILEKEIKDFMYEKGLIDYFDTFDEYYVLDKAVEAIKFADKNNLWCVDKNECFNAWQKDKEFVADTQLDNPFDDGINYYIRRFVKIGLETIEIKYYVLATHESEEIEFYIHEPEYKRDLKNIIYE